MAGKHRGEPADEAPGVLPILEGVIAAVDAERTSARTRPLRAALLDQSLLRLYDAKDSIIEARREQG